MHAFLITGFDQADIDSEAEKISRRLKAEVLEFPFLKIEEARSLSSFLKLSITKPTIILLKNIESATDEALNAFLKNLEEPQENLYFILTAESIHKVLPTIVSRCQIVKTVNNSGLLVDDGVKKFLEKPLDLKLASIDKIKTREEAIDFTQKLIFELHRRLINSDKLHSKLAENAESTILALERLKANGNVQLQLTNLVVNLV